MLTSGMQFNAVKGLVPGLAETGKIKIGRLGEERKSQGGGTYRLPEKLSHFLVTTRVKDHKDNWFLDEEVHKHLGAQPTEIPVTLVYDDPVLNAQSRLNCYDGSRRWCHGNNERAMRLDAQGIYRDRECPCPLFTAPESAEENKGKPANKLIKCKFYGVLRMQIPLKTTSVGSYGFRTTSAESFSNILGMMGTVLMRTGGILGGIPLRLRLYGSTDNTPGGASKSYKVYLDLPAGGWEEVDEAAERIVRARSVSRLNLKAIEADARRKLLALGDGSQEAETIIDELFPKPITVINGVEVLDEEPEGSNGHGEEREPDAHPGQDDPGASEKPPDPQSPSQPPAEDPNLADEAAFREAYAAEEEAKSADLKIAMIAKQVGVLRRLMERKDYVESKLKTPLDEFTRKQRLDFFQHLFDLPDKQDELPWGK